MKKIYIFALLTLLTLSLIIVSCGRGQEKLPTLMLHPHEEMPDSIDLKSYKSVFLAGTIDMGAVSIGRRMWLNCLKRLRATGCCSIRVKSSGTPVGKTKWIIRSIGNFRIWRTPIIFS